VHPDVLFAKLTAAQFNEWWLLYNDEPFGDVRSDLRLWAHACLGWGVKEVKLAWPYIEPQLTDEEILSEMERIEEALADVHSRQNQHTD
jgi:hypothetical protein